MFVVAAKQPHKIKTCLSMFSSLLECTTGLTRWHSQGSAKPRLRQHMNAKTVCAELDLAPFAHIRCRDEALKSPHCETTSRNPITTPLALWPTAQKPLNNLSRDLLNDIAGFMNMINPFTAYHFLCLVLVTMYSTNLSSWTARIKNLDTRAASVYRLHLSCSPRKAFIQ
jgi:hypothetical protein